MPQCGGSGTPTLHRVLSSLTLKPQHIVLELRSESQLGKTPGPALSSAPRLSSVRGPTLELTG